MAHDYIRISNTVLFAHLGVTEAEREVGQRIRLDLELAVDLEQSARSDQIKDTVSYEGVYRSVEAVVQASRRRLLESLAGDIMQEIFSSYPSVDAVRIVVCKLNVPFAGAVASAEVELRRTR